MTSPPHSSPIRRYCRRLAWAGIWMVLLATTAFLASWAGIQAVGSQTAWHLWLKSHAGNFLVWRLCLYGVIGYGWWRLRPRLLRREPSARARVLRVEIATGTALFLMEANAWLYRS
ncbi:hypothetical protein [Porticoccus sp.]|uniref:hypothetical protein n=1 Tax=Porticoccus sp. TaxID=2024853 RepID=UPI000C5EAD30|nr:hypothetical protein [Porticoccus sp.]MAZ69287.1 hypothetical protein [Porticoccus sp.]|tara:strand:+ start:2298 stop:2645 length:348 start_codon:yes stop_codon:yes gene_type:complete